jgi:hypothetical protein
VVALPRELKAFLIKPGRFSDEDFGCAVGGAAFPADGGTASGDSPGLEPPEKLRNARLR